MKVFPLFDGKFNKFLVLSVIFSEVTQGQHIEVTNVLVLRKQSMNTHSYGFGLWCVLYCLMQSVTVLLDHCHIFCQCLSIFLFSFHFHFLAMNY